MWRSFDRALAAAVERHAPLFASLKLHPDAVLAANSRLDWFDRQWPLSDLLAPKAR